jgi:4-hydroxy-tetrahydrodipicolinate synthase
MNLNDYSLWTALVTPLTPGLQVDFFSLEKLVKEQEQAGNGLLILGSTGEALNLSIDLRKQIVRFVTQLEPTIPIMVGVGGQQLDSQIDWIQWLETQHIHAYLMVTPIYAKPGDQGQYQWFKALMDKVTKPVMLYNVPGRAGQSLSFEAVQKLSTHPRFWAIKEASGSVAVMKEYLCASNGGKIYCGDDGLLPEFTNAGAVGLVSVASNTWPKATHLYVKQNLAQNFTATALWQKAAGALFLASNPTPAKALLCHEQKINHKTMMPPLSEHDLRDLKTVIQASEAITDWYKQQQ